MRALRGRAAARTAVWAMLLLLLARPAVGRPYTVDDLLESEAFGHVVIAPGGRWLIAERRGPLGQADNYEERSLDTLRTRLYRVDLTHPGAAAPLLKTGEDKGTIALAFSPGGTRLAIGRLHGGRWRLGVVVLASGTVRWFDVSPDHYPFRATVGWASEDRLVVIALQNNRVPAIFGDDLRSQQAQIRAWAAMRTGKVSTATVIGSGDDLARTPPPAPTVLLMIDLASGARRVLAHGTFQSIAVAPDGRHVAVIGETSAMRIRSPGLIAPGIDPRHRALTIVALATGRAWQPCPTCDVPVTLPAWAPDGRSVLFLSRGRDQAWEEGQVQRVDLATHRVRPTAGPFRAAIRTSRYAYPEVGLAWAGPIPLGFGRRGGADRADWYRLDGRPRALTGVVADPSPEVIGVVNGAPVFVANDAVWALEANGTRQILANAGFIAAATSLRTGDARGVQGGGLFGWRTVGSTMTVMLAGGRQMFIDGGRATVRPLTISRERGAVVVEATDREGVSDLIVYRGDDSPVVVARLNARLADSDSVAPIALHHRLPDGRAVTSWLYLPASRPRAGRVPLITIPYAGDVYGSEPPERWGPGGGMIPINAAVLCGHGYAVLLPSMPELAADDQGVDLAGQVLSAVDAAIATGRIDGDRLGLWGHSFGGYTVAMVASQTDRFKAIVASNGLYDLASNQGEFTPQYRLDPGANAVILQWAGYNESGQPHLGATPWDAPARYAANSPVYRARAIRTPILLLAGDRDFAHLSQSEELFSALYRQGKDAMLVTYWGESHVLASPANVRDSYKRVFDWFEGHFAGRSETPCLKLEAPCLRSLFSSRPAPSAP